MGSDGVGRRLWVDGASLVVGVPEVPLVLGVHVFIRVIVFLRSQFRDPKVLHILRIFRVFFVCYIF